jgi:hypothetical protein
MMTSFHYKAVDAEKTVQVMVDVNDFEGNDTKPFPAEITYRGSAKMGYDLDCCISADAKVRSMDNTSEETRRKSEDNLKEDVKYSFHYHTGIRVSDINSIIFIYK